MYLIKLMTKKLRQKQQITEKKSCQIQEHVIELIRKLRLKRTAIRDEKKELNKHIKKRIRTEIPAVKKISEYLAKHKKEKTVPKIINKYRRELKKEGLSRLKLIRQLCVRSATADIHAFKKFHELKKLKNRMKDVQKTMVSVSECKNLMFEKHEILCISS